MFAYGQCYTCGQPFTFNPDRVPSALVDPTTGRPPDVSENGVTVTPTREAVARSVRQPLCANCVERINARRALRGAAPFVVMPGAYEASETF